MTTRILSRRRAGSGRAVRWLPHRFARDCRGQAISEYVTLSGVIAVIVIASMTMFTRPVALTFVRLFRRLVLYMTGAA